MDSFRRDKNIVRHWWILIDIYRYSWILISTNIFFLISLQAFSQKPQPEIPRDTTYTVWSTNNKLQKQYPHIQIVKPFENSAIVQQLDVTYATLERTGNNRELKADIFYPKSTKGKLPGVVIVHGGGWRSGDKSMNIPLAQHLASKGFIVMSVEYQLSLEAKYPAAVHNLKAAIRWLRSKSKELKVDDKHIAIIGGSAGGQLASLVGATNGNMEFEGNDGHAKFSSNVQAVVDLDGLLDFTDAENLSITRNESSADVFWLGGFYDSIPDVWKTASPVYQVTSKSPPYLFINSGQTRFHAGCNAMVKKLNSLGVRSEVVPLKDAPHSYWFFEPWFTPMTEHIVKFLNQTLKKI
jgi:acetyl esterase/lipase